MPSLLRLAFQLVSLTTCISSAALGAEPGLHLAQGIIVGEVTPTTAIFQARLTAGPGLVDADVPGAPGGGRFEIARSAEFADGRQTAWLTAAAKDDFILKTQVDGLDPGTEYHYRLVYGPDTSHVKRSSAGRFKTLPAPDMAVPVNFVLTSCYNYAFFRDGHNGRPGYQGSDRDLGYPGLEVVTRLEPDFCIFDGDCVYYDHPVATRAQTQEELRRKWHEQYVMPRFVKLFSRVPTYWLKDDHDYRRNDADTTGGYAPSHALGIATFREQVPVVNPAEPDAVTYRTHQIGRDLQLWFVEGRDYRTSNAEPDGPEKTIWGAEQKAWLQHTIKESDATFKILVSPTPMIGPDDGSKRDNHVNPRGFRHEGEAFFAWLKTSGISPGRFYIVTGDRHWKYHSQHVTGYEEFSCGALNRENSRLGRVPGDPKSTDPKAQVRQFYTDQPASGGFLHVTIHPAAGARAARIAFTHRDDTGKVLYQHSRDAR